MAKYKIIPSSRTIVQSPISIGHKAEKGVEAIEFDLTAWVETYGSGTLTVIMRRWGDAIPYPVALELDENNKATWTLSDIDTAKAGMAYAQLNYIVGDEVVKKSDIYTFRVMDSLTGEGEPPEAYESWLEHLTHLAAEAMAEVLDIEGIVTDKTLTVDGGIADGKATGDALALKADKSTTYTKAEVDRMIEGVEVETDTTLEVAGAAADAAETGRQIGLLKADLGAVTGTEPISMTPGGYIKCNIETGIDVTSVVTNQNYRYAVVPCVAGEVFTVSAKGDSNGRTWAFVDDSGNLLGNAGQTAIASNLELIAPENAAYLIINDTNTGAVSYKGFIVDTTINNIVSVNGLLNLGWRAGSLLSSTGRETPKDFRIRTGYFKVSAADEFFISFDDSTDVAYVFEYGNSTVSSYIAYQTIAKPSVYIVSENVEYIRFVFGTIDTSAVISTEYADNISISKNTKKYYKNFTFVDSAYMTAYGVYDSVGPWSYTSQIPCNPGQFVFVSGAYSPDFRPIFFFDSSNTCVGMYDIGVNGIAVPDFTIIVPENSSYFVVNTNTNYKNDLKIAVFNKNTVKDLSYNSWVKISNDTGHKLGNIFTSIKSAGPLFTIVDDDGRNLTQVTKFHDVCVAAGVVGCNALATKFIEDMNSTDKETFISTLKGYELDGFQNVLHCYDHDYWVSSIDASMSDEERVSAIRRDMVRGMRDMQSYGFVDWKHWVVPQGQTDLLGVEETARNLGFHAAYDVANLTFNHFIPRDNLPRRYSIPRMELYPEDTGHGSRTLQLIKDQADICAEEGGWLIVCTHVLQAGWNNDPTFSRITEMIEYIMGKGFKNVTLSGGMSYWEDVYRMYGLF